VKREAYEWLARHRDAKPVRVLHRIAAAFERAYENDSFRGESNGEAHVLGRIAPLGLGCVFDAGANVGDWTASALAAGAERVHAFEIAPTTRAQLSARFATDARVRIADSGLASTAGIVRVSVNSRNSTIASSVITQLGPDDAIIECPVITGDQYCVDNGVEQVDFLKIDVEGADIDVLRGFDAMLAAGRVRTLQFEFTLWAAIARVWLGEFYDLLTPCGYEIGKIYPHYVDWRAYGPDQERFLRANFLASIDPDVIAVLR
jgi:FkbM family methyltransferase